MRIEINNFGPIKEFHFDLSKDLNVIFGKNNIGKSYGITAIYLLLKNLMNEVAAGRMYAELDYYFFSKFRHYDESSEQSNEFRAFIMEQENQVVSQLIKQEIDVNITEITEIILKKIIGMALLPNLEKSFDNSFSSINDLNNSFTNKNFSIKIYYKELYLVIAPTDEGHLIISELKMKKNVFVRPISSNRKPIISADQIIIYYNKKSKPRQRGNEFVIMSYILSRVYFTYREEVDDLISNIYFLPASRSGLYQALSTFSAVIAELSKSRNFLTRKIELPNISEPVSDYFLYLSNISKPNKDTKYLEIANRIESLILDGEIRFNKDSQKIVFYSEKIKAELDLSVTSSMISEIAPIVAYLKYIISDDPSKRYPYYYKKRTTTKASNIIFIEEPEAHLHPEIQVKLMEMFSNLTKCNVKIIMTTHSNYMFNKLANLILSKELKYNSVGSYLMRMSADGSYVDEIAMKADKDGIEDQNFTDVSVDLFDERMKIYDKLNE